MASKAITERYELPALGYDYGDLEPVCSRETMELHHDKHHAAYVKGANKALADLADLRDDGAYSMLNQVQKNLAFNLSGHVLHSIFWRNMSPKGGGTPQGRLGKAVTEAFGGDGALREQMTHAATGIQGSGWAALCYEPAAGRLIVEQIYDHQSNLGNGSIPLLVLDMWEHAYYLQYRNEKRRWAEGFWDIVDWSDVAERFEAAEPINLHLAA
jgi:Fe-Mn family superoxide dismutase